MGPLEKALRKVKISRRRQVEKVYWVSDTNRLLVDARRNLGLSIYQTEEYLPDIFSEAIEAAASLGL